MEAAILQQYNEYSRYLRPFTPVTFTDREMVCAILALVEPDDVASLTQLLGDRKGVIRVTLQTLAGITRLSEAVKQRRCLLKGVPLGFVEENGHFFVLTLDNVPNFISEEQIEEVMGQFGSIAGVLRDYLDYHGKKIESEKRHVLYTNYFKPDAIPRTVDVCGIQVFIRGHSGHQHKGQDDHPKAHLKAGSGLNLHEKSSRASKVNGGTPVKGPEPKNSAVEGKCKRAKEEVKKMKEHPAIR